MERKDEILKATDEYMNGMLSGPRGSFIKGAMWADEHPHMPESIEEIMNNPVYYAIYRLGNEGTGKENQQGEA